MFVTDNSVCLLLNSLALRCQPSANMYYHFSFPVCPLLSLISELSLFILSCVLNIAPLLLLFGYQGTYSQHHILCWPPPAPSPHLHEFIKGERVSFACCDMCCRDLSGDGAGRLMWVSAYIQLLLLITMARVYFGPPPKFQRTMKAGSRPLCSQTFPAGTHPYTQSLPPPPTKPGKQ